MLSNIKFSHAYVKMPTNLKNHDIVRLLYATHSRYEDLPNAFIKYDTTIRGGGSYPLKQSGACIILLLLGAGVEYDKGELFTTLRSYTPSKYQYYKSLEGCNLVVVIDGQVL